MVKQKSSAFILAGLFIAALVAVVAVKYFTSQADQGGQGWGNMGPTPVVTERIGRETFAEVVEALGTAKANESVDIMAKVTDTVRTIGFEDAQVVEKGHLLIELSDVEEAAGLAEARAGLSEANKQYNRTKELVANGTATQSRLDTAQSDRDRAIAKVQGLEAKLADRIIRAPFAGVLGLRQVSVGSLVRPGDLITTLDDISVVKVDFSVSERYLAELAAGQTVRATNVAYPGEVFQGVVASVDSRVNPVTRSVMVRANIDNSGGLLRPGMLLSMSLIVDSHDGLGVSEAALIPVKEAVSVWVVGADNTVEKRQIKVGMRVRGRVEVLSGLSEGEDVVVEGTSTVRRPGQEVAPQGPVADAKTAAGEPGEGVAGGQP